MGIFGLPPSFVAAVILMVSSPEHGATLHVAETVDVSDAIVGPKPIFDVIAASPLPAGFHPGSGYGYRASPRTGARTFHAGADFLAPVGTPVYAVREGIVQAVSENRRGSRVPFAGYGNAVVLYHPELDRWSFYAHLSEVDVAVGQKLAAGEQLGAVGNTNNGRFHGMGSHLHFEVRRPAFDGSSPFPGPYRTFNVDPERWLEEIGVIFPEEEIAGPVAPLLVVREREPAESDALAAKP